MCLHLSLLKQNLADKTFEISCFVVVGQTFVSKFTPLRVIKYVGQTGNVKCHTINAENFNVIHIQSDMTQDIQEFSVLFVCLPT